jgi:hypothetical protein
MGTGITNKMSLKNKNRILKCEEYISLEVAGNEADALKLFWQ